MREKVERGSEKPTLKVQPPSNIPLRGDTSYNGGEEIAVKEWKATLVGGSSKSTEKKMLERVPPLELEPDLEFVFALENGVVGRISKGKNIKQIQFNLCMEGYKNVRAASLGEGWVLIFSESGGDVGLAMNNKTWWEGFLKDVKPWSPLMVSSKREIWVRLYGVPLQLWNESVFRSILKPCGEVLGLDDDTKGRSRFDVARVKILASILGEVDFTQVIISQKLKFVVRIVEERGGPLEFVHVPREDDQLRWSVAGSSCDSGEGKERGTEEALMEGVVFEESESDGFVQGQHVETEEVQVVQGRIADKRNLGVFSQPAFSKAKELRPFLSLNSADKTKGDEVVGEETNEVDSVRGMSLSNSGVVGREVKGVQGVDLVGQSSVLALFSKGEGEKIGPVSLGPDLQTDCLEKWVEIGLDSEQVGLQAQVELEEGISVIDKLDKLVVEAKGKNNTCLFQNFTQEASSLSSPTTSVSLVDVKKQKRHDCVRSRKPMSRLPFPTLVGPKCLRLAEIVNNVGASNRRKKNEREGDSKKTFPGSLQQSDEDSLEGGTDEGQEVSISSQQNVSTAIGVQEVVAPISGVNFLLGDEALEDVDEYVVKRKAPEAKILEAEEIFEIQEALGLNFVEGKDVTVTRLVDLEDRDREKMGRIEEVQGFQ
ncbi:hypothetical protein P8452_22381 [Trifolium repens]|nr:hypothetical protein P8452_22381 [Trifolium repens]